ncbi:dockerin type I repeat-containing protein [uncultured Desulfobacter sp.]|uniref:dockerin type I repeat-containing protein n=1 Tax=uncultured Desulfobacter sp. TaxID=240139 RepID=UPI0029F51A9D|nr:dockerin type I repeat-containing protein [uncultured Desulfobacter sp.]
MVKKKSKFKKSLLALPILIFLMCGSAFAQVSVYAQGAYTDSDLKVYIYADVSSEPIISFGVKLTYDTTEVSINEDEVANCLQRNDDVWYFGDPNGTTYKTQNAGPVVTVDNTTGSGSVVFVGGKIDSTETTQTGVEVGDRILLGIVTFSRVDTGVVPTVSLSLGKDGGYENFVELDGGLLDSAATITGSVEIHERGDANGDGDINVSDLTKLKEIMFGQSPKTCYADCNDDGDVNVSDITCMKPLMF